MYLCMYVSIIYLLFFILKILITLYTLIWHCLMSNFDAAANTTQI